MIHITFSLIAELMLWGTIPLWGVLGFWESKLSLTDTEHTLIQIFLVVAMVGWAYLWYSLGEYERLAHSTPQDAIHPYHNPNRGRFTMQGNSGGMARNADKHGYLRNKSSNEIGER